MKIDITFPEIVRNIYGKELFYFYFLNENISLIKHDPYLKLNICIENIAIEGTVSQIFDKGPGSFSTKSRNKYSKLYIKSYPFFVIK